MLPASGIGHVRSIAIVWLVVAAAPAFAVTTALSRIHHAELARLAGQEAARGDAALHRGDATAAVADFRDALTYARDNPSYRFRLAGALAAAGDRVEARNYFLVLWDAEPGDGRVNLALGRLAAQDHDLTAAIRYYHAAIEGAWDEQAPAARRLARLELTRLLLDADAVADAEPDLVALASEPPADPAGRNALAAMLMRANLTARAQAIYAMVLASNPRDAEALSGIGEAELRQKNYPRAAADLSRALANGASDPSIRADAEVASLVVSADPFQRRLGIRARADRAATAFDAARARLAACQSAYPADAHLAELAASMDALRRDATAPRLMRDPDHVDQVMDLVFDVEPSVTGRCGAPSGLDRALQLLAEARKSER